MPPSTGFVFMTQCEDDRAFLYELVDLMKAERAPQEIREKVTIGRVMVAPLMGHLSGADKAGNQNYREDLMGFLEAQTGWKRERIFEIGYYVRCFSY